MTLSRLARRLLLESNSFLKYDLYLSSDDSSSASETESKPTPVCEPLKRKSELNSEEPIRKKFKTVELTEEMKDMLKVNTARYKSSESYALYLDSRQNAVKFYEYTRMSVETFDYVLHNSLFYMQTCYSKSNKTATPGEKLFLTLRFLAHRTSLPCLSKSIGLGRNTLFNYIYRTLNSLSRAFSHIYMPQPTLEVFEGIAEEFYNIWQFPNCIGTIGEKYLRITKQVKEGSDEVKFKKFYTLVVQGISDADYKFIATEVCPNKVDGTFYTSNLNKMLNNNQFNVPPMKVLPQSNIKVPHVLLGDEAYPLKSYLMRPYTGRVDNDKNVFNKRLNRTRVTIQGAFSVLTYKWRILAKPLDVNPKHAKLILNVACLLHNIVRERDGNTDSDFKHCLRNLSNDKSRKSKRNNRVTSRAITVRDFFKDYFVGHPI